MHHTAKYDFFPDQKIAGITQRVSGESAANCVKPTQEAPDTPPQIKKYRKSYKQQAGQTILHFGVADDKVDKQKAYGHLTKQSDHANQCLENKNHEGIKDLITSVKENKYASRHNEPLGRGMERNYNFPDYVNQEGFSYGAKTKANEFSGKEIMFPQQNPKETQDALDVYLKSFGDQSVGAQKNRGYNWPVDKQQHRFGKKEQAVPNEVQYCLNQEALQDQFPKTTIVKKKQEDFRNYTHDNLGKSKNLAQVNTYVNKDQAFGGRPKGFDEWNVGQCIKGESTWKEAQPDQDLGKTLKHGFKNEPKQGDENRVFGVPTIRNDITKKGMKSVADPNNYGDEANGIELLFPQKYDHMGVTQDDFNKLRTKEEIRSIFEAIGYKYKTGKFEGIFTRAKEIQQIQQDQVSVRAFQAAVNEMDKIQ